MVRSWLRGACALALVVGGCEGAVVEHVESMEPSDGSAPDGGAHDASMMPHRDAMSGTARDASGGNASLATNPCDAPIALVDTSKPTTVVGTGPGTCSEAQLEAALKKGGVITFDCGDDATIAITSEKSFASGVDTTLDGEGKVTLDGQGKTRILSFYGPDFQKTTTKLTVQRLKLVRGKATGTMMFPSASAPCSQGYQDGSGGAIYVRDADLRIIDGTFEDNQCASPGPDVAGGAVYAVGSIATTIVGSTFTDNQGSNGGAVGALWGNLRVYNSVFRGNRATGSGANSVNSTCPEVGGQREVGSGGNGGAIVIDGGENFGVVICGSSFVKNIGGDGALGGAVFRTPDVDVQSTDIDRCTFDANESATGALYFHHSKLNIAASTFSNNVGRDGTGAIQVDDTTLTIVNSTFSKNQALRAAGGGAGPRGGAISSYGNGGTIQNSTFVGNTAAAGDGSVGGALIGASMFTITNSLFVDDQTPACDGSASGSNDMQWPSGGTSCVNGAVSLDPQLGMLQDNGGPTPTALPAAGSPAAKGGSNCPKTDQRGYARSSACSLGAVEVGATK